MKYLSILFLAIFLFVSCSDELIVNFTSLEEATVGVSSKKTYTIESNQMISVEDYEYNSKGELTKKSYYGGNRETIYYYEQYIYNTDGLLKYKIKNNSNIYSPTGFLTLDSTVFNYSTGLLISKKTIYPLANTYDEVKYEYDESKLKVESFYYNDTYLDKIIYEYEKGRINNKLHYNNTDILISITKYLYNDDFLNETLKFTSNNELLTKTNYEYYNNGKLKKETFEVLAGYLSISSHIALYEY